MSEDSFVRRPPGASRAPRVSRTAPTSRQDHEAAGAAASVSADRSSGAVSATGAVPTSTTAATQDGREQGTSTHSSPRMTSGGSLSTAPSEISHLRTPTSPILNNSPLRFNFVESPTTMPGLTASPVVMSPAAWGASPTGLVDKPKAPRSPLRPPANPTISTRTPPPVLASRPWEDASKTSHKRRPSPLELQKGAAATSEPRDIPESLDTATTSWSTESRGCTASYLTDTPDHSTISNELLDLSALRRSVQQNLRERPLSVPIDSDSEMSSITSESPREMVPGIAPAEVLGLARSAPSTTLFVDTRPLDEYVVGHLARAVPLCIPSPALPRLRKQIASRTSGSTSGPTAWTTLGSYVSTNEGKRVWEAADLGKQLDVVLIGTDDRDDTPSPLVGIITPFVSMGAVRVLRGGWPTIARLAQGEGLVATGDGSKGSEPNNAMWTRAASMTQSPLSASTDSGSTITTTPNTARVVPKLSLAAPSPSQSTASLPGPSPMRPTPALSLAAATPTLITSAPAGPSSRRPPQLCLNLDNSRPGMGVSPIAKAQSARPARPKPALLTIDVGDTNRLGAPHTAQPGGGGSLAGGLAKRSPGLKLQTRTGGLAPPGEPWTANLAPPPAPGGVSTPVPYPTTPGLTPGLPPIPQTPAPVRSPQPLEVSTILPSFLYLGPEILTRDDVDVLQGLGVRRILNVALECDDDEGLGLRKSFERYHRIPMRDAVEESGVGKGIQEACDFLDDARLHSAPTYVHCRAGKSRSVTVVLAYLIHANAWTLKTSYAYVAERRHGISPNIGFVAELIQFEEAELRSPGANTQRDESTPEGTEDEPPLIPREPRIGPRYTRESLPPEWGSANLSLMAAPSASPSLGNIDEPDISPENAAGRMRRQPQADIEVRKNGQWVHGRRAPVDRTTLQPGRRVSKAGLESILGPLQREERGSGSDGEQ